jgi:hypothetical protein
MRRWTYVSQCPWKIHFGVSQDATVQCGREEHADPDHEGQNPFVSWESVISWQAGDRREYTGEWPGACPEQPCTLHAGHHGRHAP